MINGECLCEMDKLIAEGVKVDMCLTDPPYGATACKWDSVIPIDEMWLRINKLIKPNGCIALFSNEPFSSYLRISNIKKYKYDWIWDKTRGFTPQLANIQPLKSHENICIFGNGKITYFPQKSKLGTEVVDMRKGKSSVNKKDGSGTNIFTSKRNEMSIYTDRYPLSIIKFSKNPSTEKLHPTQKPVTLLEYLICTYTKENEIVLDFTMGSGSTGVACKNTNRDFIGIELDKKYFDMAKKRIEETPISLFGGEDNYKRN